jgi:thymidylate synthase ThyX
MPDKRQIYLLDPQKYSPETIAVAFAKTSRSPESFAVIADELNAEKSAEFNEKWVVGYGHSSVAEHAVLHIAVENISRLACECLESNRLASYTEKSTRYQTWKNDAFYVPPELEGKPLQTEYMKTCQTLLETYLVCIERVTQYLSQVSPQQPEESASQWQRRIRSATIDSCRYLLPSAVLANVGLTINARALEHALVKMLSHPLQEVRSIGAEVKAVAVAAIPTLLKYANPDQTLQQVQTTTTSIPGADRPEQWCQLIFIDPDAETRILAAFYYRTHYVSYVQCLETIAAWPLDQRQKIAREMVCFENCHESPLRELEYSTLTFDITIDQGAYYEVKRHRMFTLTPQPLTASLGYALPKLISQAGCEPEFQQAMARSQYLFADLQGVNPALGGYIVPNAALRRFLLSGNLRSLWHFIQLRSAPNAHFAVRRLAQQLYAEVTHYFPAFAEVLLLDTQESTATLERDYFTDIIMRKNDNQ